MFCVLALQGGSSTGTGGTVMIECNCFPSVLEFVPLKGCRVMGGGVCQCNMSLFSFNPLV